MLTMLLGGLWHGANWTFVIWGGLHGAGLAVERRVRRAFGWGDGDTDASLASIPAWLKRIVVFHVVCLAWIFFRAQSMGDAFALLSGLGTLGWRPEYASALAFLALFALSLLVVDLVNESRREECLFDGMPEPYRVAVGLAMMALVTLYAANQLNAFIYFRF
jgi:D-alanyl-lipoteichoic acid acyltransferase DltB (MBOAT superfamily)